MESLSTYTLFVVDSYPGTEAIDTQFLWGHELLISPVLAEVGYSLEIQIYIMN